MNAIKKAILGGCKTAEDVGKKFTEERNAGIVLKKGEEYPPPVVVPEVEFDSAMASVQHVEDLKKAAEEKLKATKPEGSK